MSRNSDKNIKEAPLLRKRFWDIYQKRPDYVKSYAKLAGISYRAFGDFVMGRSIFEPKTYAQFENWIIEQEKV